MDDDENMPQKHKKIRKFDMSHMQKEISKAHENMRKSIVSKSSNTNSEKVGSGENILKKEQEKNEIHKEIKESENFEEEADVNENIINEKSEKMYRYLPTLSIISERNNSIENLETENGLSFNPSLFQNEENTYHDEILDNSNEYIKHKTILTTNLENIDNITYTTKEFSETDWFDSLNINIIVNWEKILLSNKTSVYCRLNYNENQILNQELIHKEKKIIFNDSERSRNKDKKYFPEFRNLIEKCLNYYCEENNFLYKQGINEVISPFLFLMLKYTIPLSKVFNLFSMFVKKFQTNFYIESDFYSLKYCLELINLLLKYHDPMLYYIFEYTCIKPEMYATNWLLTFIFGKCSLGIVYFLIDIFIQENDEIFILFFITAFMSFNRNKIINGDLSIIPMTVNTLTIQTIEECQNIYELALEFRDKTPFSFRVLVDNNEIFNPARKGKKTWDIPLFIPFFPAEILYYTYPKIVNCPNKRCSNFINNEYFKKMTVFQKRKNSINTYHFSECKFCHEKSIFKEYVNYKNEETLLRSFSNEMNNHNSTSNLIFSTKKKLYSKKLGNDPLSLINLDKVNLMILDLRYEEFKNDEKKSGFIPFTISPSYDEIRSSNVSNIYINIYLLYILIIEF